MSLLATRVFLEVAGKPFLRRLVFPYFLVILLIAAADATTDWNATRQQLASWPPMNKAAVLGGLIAAWSIICGRALQPVWNQPSALFLMRQPINSYEWSARLLPSLSIALIPIIGILWLGSYGAPAVIHYLGFIGLCLPIILGASLRGLVGGVVVTLAALILSALLFSYAHHRAVPYLALVITLPLLVLSASLVRRQSAVVNAYRLGHLSSSNVVRALVRRDLLCIHRTRKSTTLELLTLGTLTSLMMLAFRVNGEVVGREAFLTACILFLIGTSTLYRNLELAKARLGKEMMRQHWPVTYSERAIALLVLISMLAAPSALPIAALGSTMGLTHLLLYMVFVLTTVALTAALFAASLRNKASSVGLFFNLIVAHGVVVSLLPSWIYAMAAPIAATLGFLRVRAALERFAVSVEGTAIHEPA